MRYAARLAASGDVREATFAGSHPAISDEANPTMLARRTASKGKTSVRYSNPRAQALNLVMV